MFKAQPLCLVSLILLACVAACGSKFESSSGSSSGSGGAADSGAASDGGASEAGAPATGGDGASAGESTGGSSSAGDTSVGGRATAGSGGSAHGGASAGGASAGGASAGNGSAGAAGADCAALKAEYAALVKKARVCDEGSTDQCTTESKAPVIGCGCPTLVNVKSEYTALAAEKYKAIEKNGCNNGPICQIACLQPTSASCAKTSGMGSSEFVCTGTNGVIAN
ncbi:MAG: hypothetical protein ABIQ16_00995 [Polyangiaceae bacterium]